MQYVTLAGYILSFILQLATLILGVIYIIKHPFKLNDITERLILSVIFFLYFLNVLEKLVHFGTTSKWFYDMLPFGNMSPLLFTIGFICAFLPKNIRRYMYPVFCVLMIGMVCAGLKNGFERIFKFEDTLYTCIVSDAWAHILIALFGFYIIRNEIIEFNKKEELFSILFCFGCALTALVINAIFDTEFFGLNLNGKHQIYHIRISENSYVSALCYFIGLGIVILIGVFTIKLIKRHLLKNNIDIS